MFLKRHPKFCLIFDPHEPDIKHELFNNGADWKEFYGDIKEERPPGCPEPLGNALTISCFVDANHTGNVVTRRLHTGILIFIQKTCMIQFSKRQNSVESATYGSESTALRIAQDLLVALCLKLMSFAIPINGPCNVFMDNEAVFECKYTRI